MWRLASLFFLIPSLCSLAQPSLNDFRSAVEDGPWNTNASWERFDGTAWVPAAFPPALGDGRITILAGHLMQMEVSELIDDVIVDGILYVAPTAFISFPPLLSGDGLVVNGILELEGALELSPSSIVRINGSLNRYTGSDIVGSTTSNMFFENNSFYEHSILGALPLASWSSSSTLILSGIFNSLPPNSNQSFGNVHIELSGSLPLSMNGQMTSINGNFEILSNKPVRFGGSTPYAINIGGDFVKSGTGTITWHLSTVTGTINIAGSFIHNSGNIINSVGSINLSIGGDYRWNGSNSFTGGNILFSGTQPQNFVNTAHNTFVSTVNITVGAGSVLNLANSSIGGSGTNFTLNAGASLWVGATNPEGAIANSTTAGNLRMAVGSRTYQAGSTIEYNGSLTQYMGNGHPTLTGVTTVIDNPNEVILISNPIALNGPVILNNGAFNISDVNLTLGGTLSSNGGVLVANQNTSLTITDTGSTASFGEIHLSNTSVIGSLAIAGAVGRNVKLGTNLAVVNNLSLSNGELELNGFALNSRGSITQSAGVLVGSATSGLRITNEGGGTLPASLSITGGELQSLELDRATEILMIPSNLTISDIILTSGTLTHTGSINIQPEGSITIGTGILTNEVTAITSYSVKYTGVGSLNTANEISSVSTALADLTIDKPYPFEVTLSSDVTINGSLEIAGGALLGTSQSLTLRGNFVSNGNVLLNGGLFTFDGATTFSGDSIPQLTDILISNNSSLIVQSNQQINVSGNFTNHGLFNPAEGTILLNGSTNQDLTGDNNLNIYSLAIQKQSSSVSILTQTTIQSSLRINTGTTLNAGNELLTLVSNAQRTARINPLHNSAQITGNIIVQRYVPNGTAVRAYRYLTPGVSNSTVADWQAEVPITGTFGNPSTGVGIISSNPSLFYYDESFIANGTGLESRYRNYPASGLSNVAPLQSGRGYAIFVRSTTPITLDTRGTVATHVQEVDVTAISANQPDGWNLIGNPYASPILWSRVNLGAGIGNAIYIPDNTNLGGLGAGSFISYVDGVSIPAGFGGVVDSGQAFWIHTSANSTLTFNESSKVVGSDTLGQLFREKEDIIMFRVNVSGTAKDELVIRFADYASDSFENKYDALKLKKSGLNFYSKSFDGKDLAINTFNILQCFQSISLYFSQALAGTYKMKLFDYQSLPSDVNVILFDSWLNTSVDLRTNEEYAFSVLPNQIEQLSNRFRLDISRDRIEDKIGIQSPAICSSQTEGKVLILQTQPEFQYRLLINDKESSKWLDGTGQGLEFLIPVQSLDIGEHPYTIELKSSCLPPTLLGSGLFTITNSPTLSFTSLPVNVCTDKVINISVPAQLDIVLYKWYEYEFDETPLAVTDNPNVLLSNDQGNLSSLYISGVSANGCESTRSILSINKVTFPEIEIIREGNILKTHPTHHAFWYLNEQPINAIAEMEIKISETGIYRALIEKAGCFNSIESFEQVTEEGYLIFPNPFKSEVHLQLDEDAHQVYIAVITSLGSIKRHFTFKNSQNKLLELKLEDMPTGVYYLLIETNRDRYFTKILKVD
jgi:hypothetical protein